MRHLSVLVLACLVLGCVGQPARTDAGAHLRLEDGLVLRYRVEGEVWPLSPTLPLSALRGPATLTLSFTADEPRLDGRLALRDAFRVRVEADGKVLGDLLVGKDGLVQTHVMKPDGDQQRFFWQSPGAWCFFASALPPRLEGDEWAVEAPPYLGEAAPVRVTLARDGEDVVLGRPAVRLAERGRGEDGVRLWVQPGFPCPLRAEGRTNVFAAIPSRFALHLEEATVTGDAPLALGGTLAPPPSWSPRTPGERGLPPDAAASLAFPPRVAFERARAMDGAFDAFLDAHPAALVVQASPFHGAVGGEAVHGWAFLVSDGRAHHEVELHRHVGEDGERVRIVSSGTAEAIPPLAYSPSTLARGWLDLGTATEWARHLLARPVEEVAFRTFDASTAIYEARFTSASAARDCGPGCAGVSRVEGWLEVDATRGGIITYVGPEDGFRDVPLDGSFGR